MEKVTKDMIMFKIGWGQGWAVCLYPTILLGLNIVKSNYVPCLSVQTPYWKQLYLASHEFGTNDCSVSYIPSLDDHKTILKTEKKKTLLLLVVGLSILQMS